MLHSFIHSFSKLKLCFVLLLLSFFLSTFGQSNFCDDKALNACDIADPNSDDECFRMTFPLYFDYTGQQQPPPTDFDANYIKIEGKVQGDGFIDVTKTKVVAALDPLTDFYDSFSFSADLKTFYWIVPCQDNLTQFEFPFGNCQYPLLEVVVIAEPGTIQSPNDITIETIVESLSLVPIGVGSCNDTKCTMTSIDPFDTKAIPPLCASGITAELVGIPAGPVDPHVEVPLSLKIKNGSGAAISVSELDFRIRISDEYANLPDPTLDPNTPGNDPPAYYIQQGDEYYYYLNSLMGGNTIPDGGEVIILNFSVLPPQGLENLLGESNISVEFVRLNIDGGSCCILDVSNANGKVTYPGVLPCAGSPIDDVSIVIGPIQNTGILEDCELGFVVYINTPSDLTVESLLLEFDTEVSGSMILEEIIPSGLTCTPTINCPSSGSGNCLECNSHTVLINFDNSANPLFISSGDGLTIIMSGLNGSLDNVVFRKAAMKVAGMVDACIPDIVFDQNLSFPLQNNCNFCDDVTIEIGSYSGQLGPMKGNCEEGFSIYLNAPDLTFWERISVEFQFQNPNNLPLSIYSYCPGTNACPPSGISGTLADNCTYVTGNTIFYQYCPSTPISFGTSQIPVLDVKFKGIGCISDFIFTADTEVDIQGLVPCNPRDITSISSLEFCSTCLQGQYTISGSIVNEKEDGIDVPVDPPGSGLTSGADLINSGIFIINATEVTDCDFTDADGNCDVLTSTTGSCTGNYDGTVQCNTSSQFSIKPYKDINPLNGVTTFDLVLITKHILGTQLLDSPYKIIAADANKSSSITTFDMVEIRKLILFINTEFPNNTSWRFVDKGYVFPDPSNPWQTTFPECVTVDLSGQSGTTNVDFIAIKTGDVNNSHACNQFTGAMVDERGTGVALVASGAHQINAGKTVEVAFSIKSPQGLVAWETGLRFDPAYLQLEEALPGTLDGMTPGNFGLTEASEGKVRVLWYAPDGRPGWFGEARHAFSLRFKVLHPIEDWSSVLTTDDSILQGRAYEDDGTEHALRLDFTDEIPAAPGRVEEKPMQVTAVPNPFRDELRLFITVPEDDWIEVSVFDVNGRLVASRSGETTNRQMEVLFQHTKSWGSGVFTYRVRTARQSVTGKITKQ